MMDKIKIAAGAFGLAGVMALSSAMPAAAQGSDVYRYQPSQIETPAPYVLDELQRVERTFGNRGASDFPLEDGNDLDAVDLDIRREAQREAALSFGARGGLAKRNFEIMESLTGYEDALDRVFDFRQLLIHAPSGMMIEPPIIKESIDALTVVDDGLEAAVSDRIYNISKNAKITTAPRNWRQYLRHDWSEVKPPPSILWPRDQEEEIRWSDWVAEGWEKGYSQADEMFDANLNRLTADFNGMVRYKMLLAKGLVSSPYALHEDRGVTGGGEVMRVGDRAIRITGPSAFNTSPEAWKALDR
tara:strand:- start:3219 stop:4121 length:903 start_codon:yes stop_codon:yes gene_type:complete